MQFVFVYSSTSITFSVGSSSRAPAGVSVSIQTLNRNIDASTNTWKGCSR